MEIEIRRASLDRVGEVTDILAEATAWIRTLGVVQWPDRFAASTIAAVAEHGDLYLVTAGGQTVGTVTLQWSDPVFWGDRHDAGFLHRLAIRRAYAGLGRKVIEWADGEVATRGRSYLCLDAMSANVRLKRYYEDLGFIAVKEIAGPNDHPYAATHGPWQATLYERRVRSP